MMKSWFSGIAKGINGVVIAIGALIRVYMSPKETKDRKLVALLKYIH